MAIPRARILELTKLQCTLFNTTFNPQRLRLGNKVLRQRLKGSILAQYYPPKIGVSRELKRAYPNWDFDDEVEVRRTEKIEAKKARGKGTPKKRTAAESKKLTKRKR